MVDLCRFLAGFDVSLVCFQSLSWCCRALFFFAGCVRLRRFSRWCLAIFAFNLSILTTYPIAPTATGSRAFFSSPRNCNMAKGCRGHKRMVLVAWVRPIPWNRRVLFCRLPIATTADNRGHTISRDRRRRCTYLWADPTLAPRAGALGLGLADGPRKEKPRRSGASEG